jgi:hypothetical protein
METLMTMKIPAGSSIRAILPKTASVFYRQALDFFSRELQRRVEVYVETAFGGEGEDDFTEPCRIWFCTLETLPESLTTRIEEPFTIRAFPDYAEHINLRSVESEGVLTILLLCGSEKALLAGAGFLLRALCPFEGHLLVDAMNCNYRPLTPLRGHVFANAMGKDYFRYREEQWETMLSDCALLGNNTVGFLPVYFPDWTEKTRPEKEPESVESDLDAVWSHHWRRQRSISERAHELGLRVVVSVSIAEGCDVGKDGYVKQLADLLEDLPYIDTVWVNCQEEVFPFYRPTAVSVERYMQQVWRLRDELASREGRAEFWLSTAGLTVEQISNLIDLLFERSDFCASVLTSGPGEGYAGMLMREMPLMMQFVSMTSMSEMRQMPVEERTYGPERCYVYGEDTPITLFGYLGKHYFEHAPMTYGALGVSSRVHDELHRFFWSMISWDPQPELEAVFALYGRYYFGEEAAPYLCNALKELELCWRRPESEAWIHAEKAEEELERALQYVPPRMRHLAFPRYYFIKYRILVETSLREKIVEDRERLERVLGDLAGVVSDPGVVLRLMQEKLQEGRNPDSFLPRLHNLRALQVEIIKEWNVEPCGADRLEEPLSDAAWVLAKVQKALLSGDESKQNQCLAELQQRRDLLAGAPGFLIDCGNPNTDTCLVSGQPYFVSGPEAAEPVSRWMMALSVDEETAVEYVIPVDGRQCYRATFWFCAPRDFALRMAVVCGKKTLDPRVAVEAGQRLEKSYVIDSELCHSNEMVVKFVPRENCRAGISEMIMMPMGK